MERPKHWQGNPRDEPGLPSFLVPYGAPKKANPYPNEGHRVERLWQGITASATLLALLYAARLINLISSREP